MQKIPIFTFLYNIKSIKVLHIIKTMLNFATAKANQPGY